MKYLKKGMSIVKLIELKNKTKSKKIKDKIDKQIKITKEKNEEFVACFIKSKWFGLGVEQTMRKKQGVRVLVGQLPIL